MGRAGRICEEMPSLPCPPPLIDLRGLTASVGVDLDAAVAELRGIYSDVDRRNAVNTGHLDLPCHRGCDMCCHESVFLTPLEFFAVWDYVQVHLDEGIRAAIVARGLALYEEHGPRIRALDEPPPNGAEDHFAIARELRFTCPLLGAEGECRVYPVRELYARLFGCTFNETGGIYGCHWVGSHLAGKQVTLLRARPQARRLADLPLTQKRQVYPYYIHMLYGEYYGR